MKRLIILTNSLSGGGAETSALILKKNLSAQGIDVTLIGINADNPFNVPTSKEVFSLNRDKSKPITSTILALIKFRTYVSSQKFDAIIVNCELPELFSVTAPRHIHLAIVEHANPAWFQREQLGRIIRSALKRRTPLLITVGEHLQPKFFKNLPYFHIPNPLEEVDSQEVVLAQSEIKRLVYLGRLSSAFKNPLSVLKVAKLTDLPVIMIGDGDMMKSLKSYAYESKLDCVFTGFQIEPWRLIRSGDLMIIPSSAEGDGLTLVEAIQRKVPFLASQIPDLNRYGISQSNYCANIEEFANVVNVYRNRLEELVVPENLAKKILESRAPKKVADKWINLLYRSII